MKETPILEWQDIEEVRSKLPACPPVPGFASVLYRGETAKNPGLLPTLLRELKKAAAINVDVALTVEQAAKLVFFDAAHLHVDLPDDLAPCDGWAVMQHYGAPTRLLDWTASLYVALFFAVEDLEVTPGVVWVFDFAKFRDDRAFITLPWQSPDQQKFFADHKYEHLLVIDGWIRANRKRALLVDHSIRLVRAVDTTQDIMEPYLQRLVVEPSLKPEFLRRLREMNITPATLFPGVDGLGRAAAHSVRLMTRN